MDLKLPIGSEEEWRKVQTLDNYDRPIELLTILQLVLFESIEFSR